MKNLILPLFLLAVAQPSWAEGVRGGDTIFKVQGRWELYDIFSLKAGESYELSPQFHHIIDQEVKPLVEEYVGLRDSAYWIQVTANDQVDIRFVDTVSEAKKLCGGDGTTHAHAGDTVGCTDNNGTTFFVKSRFNELDNTSKLLAILHERAHAYSKTFRAPLSDEHAWINPFILGVDVMLKTVIDQDQNHFRTLSKAETLALSHLTNNPLILWALSQPNEVNHQAAKNLRSYYQRYVTPQGGGIVLLEDNVSPAKDLAISADSFLDIRSRLRLTTDVCDFQPPPSGSLATVLFTGQSKITHSKLDCLFGDHAMIKDSIITRINATSVLGTDDYAMSSSSRLRNVIIQDSKLESWGDLLIENTQLFHTTFMTTTPALVEITHSEFRHFIFITDSTETVKSGPAGTSMSPEWASIRAINRRFIYSQPTIYDNDSAADPILKL